MSIDLNHPNQVNKSSGANMKFEKLSFKDDVDISGYREALDFAFGNRDIKNIAISGPYGSGKSSILATYEKESKDKRIIHISLAHFGSLEKISEGDNGKIESSLEGKILNQLIHQVDEKKIPQTNFRIKSSLSKWDILIHTFLAVALLTSVIHLVFSYTWIAFVSSFGDCWLRALLEWTTTPGSFFVSGCVGLGIITYYIKSSVTTQRYHSAVRKLSLQGNDIELFENEDDSFLDKYLNEVLYLVEESGIDAIVFEDMDRYKMESIFVRLREVNTLANLRLNARDKERVLRFIFLLRDDLFDSKDRTKFFDYIIPVVPVVDSSNSYDQLRFQLQRSGVLDELDNQFLEGLAIYIDDMRVLINICNEYQIYYQRLDVKNNQLRPERLLALIAYKNLFPKDFSLLQANHGYVHAVFACKPNLIMEAAEDLRAEIAEKEKQIAETRSEVPLKKRELMNSFAVKYLGGTYISSIKGRSDSELDKLIRDNIPKADLPEYVRRLENADKSVEQIIKNIRIECDELEHKINVISGQHLYEIIPHGEGKQQLENISWKENGEEKKFTEVKNSYYFDLLSYLILNGYIDESYQDYIAYFYPNSLSRNDKIFVRRVFDRQESEFSYALDNPARVLEKLRVEDFDFAEVLNFNLLDHLLHFHKESAYLKHLVLHLRRTRNYKFVSQYLKVTAENDTFVQAINTMWDTFIHEVITQESLEPEQLRRFTLDTLHYASDELLRAVNVEGTLCRYISTSPDYLNIEKVDTEKIISAFVCLGVKFESIDFSVSNTFLFTKVYKCSLYQINMENVNLMLTKMLNIPESEQLKKQNYSILCQDTLQPLFIYIHQNIAKYFEKWLSVVDEIKDTERSAIAVLDNQEIPYGLKEKYIRKLSTVISDLKMVDDSNLWELLLSEKRIGYSEGNVLSYWMKVRKMDDTIIQYINSFKEPINFADIRLFYASNDRKEFFEQVVSCQRIRNDRYREIVSTIKIDWNYSFNVPNLDQEKVKILVESNLVSMVLPTLQFMRSKYPGLLNIYISANIEDYAGIMTASQLAHNELLMVLDMDVPDEIKKRLISLSSAAISIKGKGYSDDVKMYILEHKLEPNDIPTLYLEYERLSDSFKDFTLKKALGNLNSILNGTVQISEQLTCDILASTELSATNKHKLLLFTLRKAPTESDAKAFLYAAGRDEFAKIFNRRMKLHIRRDAQNKEILDVFKANHWIKGYTLNADSTEYIVERVALAKKRDLVGVT